MKEMGCLDRKDSEIFTECLLIPRDESQIHFTGIYEQNCIFFVYKMLFITKCKNNKD